MARRFDKVFAPLGLTNGQFSTLVALSGAWRPKLGELAAFLAMDQTTMTAATKALERRGLLVITTDKADGRIRRPALTEAGRQIVAQAVPLWRDEHRQLQASVGPENAMALVAALGRLA